MAYLCDPAAMIACSPPPPPLPWEGMASTMYSQSSFDRRSPNTVGEEEEEEEEEADPSSLASPPSTFPLRGYTENVSSWLSAKKKSASAPPPEEEEEEEEDDDDDDRKPALLTELPWLATCTSASSSSEMPMS